MALVASSVDTVHRYIIKPKVFVGHELFVNLGTESMCLPSAGPKGAPASQKGVELVGAIIGIYYQYSEACLRSQGLLTHYVPHRQVGRVNEVYDEQSGRRERHVERMPWCRVTHWIALEEDPGHLGIGIFQPSLIVKEHRVDKVAWRRGVDVK